MRTFERVEQLRKDADEARKRYVRNGYVASLEIEALKTVALLELAAAVLENKPLTT